MLSSRFLARAAARPLLSSSTHVRVANTISTAPLSTGVDGKMKAPKMVYISGEEMTNYCMNLILEKWIQPHFDTSAWEFYDLSCTGRDNSDDKVLHDAVDAGKRIGAIFKEPTVTPSATQVKEMGLKKQWGSPNGAMRRGWNGITISRDTIHIDGMELGFKKPVLFERQAVGGEYAAGHKMVGAGDVKTIFYPKDGSESQIVDQRVLDGSKNAVVTYDNPYNGVEDLAHHFFTRCLKVGVTPYVVTKKTVFKWQEMFWVEMKQVFDEHYATKFKEAGLLDKCGGDLQHLISDAATMQIIRWTDGGFGMAAHNYDGDMLTDEVAQVHRSPGFITSNLIGKSDDGTLIKEYEASHGTVSDMWLAHLRGEPTSLNPLGLVEALIGAMQHAAALDPTCDEEAVVKFTNRIRSTIHKAMVAGKGTQDICGASGLTTEAFVDLVGGILDGSTPLTALARKKEKVRPSMEQSIGAIDQASVMKMFKDLDEDGNGVIDFEEFAKGLIRLGVQPKKFGFTA